MSELELRNKAEIEAIELTEDEMKAAIQEAKIKKWYHIKNDLYWLKKEFGNKVGRAVWVVLLLVASSCSIKVNLTKEQRRDIEARRFSRFKLSHKEVVWNTASFFVGYSIGKEVRKKIDSK